MLLPVVLVIAPLLVPAELIKEVTLDVLLVSPTLSAALLPIVLAHVALLLPVELQNELDALGEAIDPGNVAKATAEKTSKLPKHPCRILVQLPM